MQTTVKSFRAALVGMVPVFLVATLICWLGTSHTAWAQEDAASPSFNLRADPLEVEAKQEGKPPTKVIVSNGDGTGLEFSAEVEDSEGLFGTQASPSLSFLNDPLELEKEGDKEITADVIVRNDRNRGTDLVFSTVLTDTEGNPQEVNFEPQDSIGVEPYSVTNIELKVHATELERLSMPLEGFLVVSGEDGDIAPGTLPLTVSEPKALPTEFLTVPTINWAILLPLIMSILVVVPCSYKVIFNSFENLRRGHGPIEQKVGLLFTLGEGLNLDFGKSWASTLTVVAAIVTVVTGAEVFPEQRPYVAEEQIEGLFLFFGAMIVFAPALYDFTRRRRSTTKVASTDTENLAKDEESQLQGYIWAFIIASALIVWAFLGQLLVAGFLVCQASPTAMPILAKTLLIGAIAVAAVGALIHSGYTVYSSLKEKEERNADYRKKALEEAPEDRKEDLRDFYKEVYIRERPQSML